VDDDDDDVWSCSLEYVLTLLGIYADITALLLTDELITMSNNPFNTKCFIFQICQNLW
jgi:hypothetical protein